LAEFSAAIALCHNNIHRNHLRFYRAGVSVSGADNYLTRAWNLLNKLCVIACSWPSLLHSRKVRRSLSETGKEKNILSLTDADA